MTVSEAFDFIKTNRPQVVFVNGKTSTGKTTFANRLMRELDYGMVEMDDVARTAVIRPLGLPDTGHVHVEIYKNRNRLDWIAVFLAAVQQQVRDFAAQDQPVVIDGTMPNVTTIEELLSPLPPAEILFFSPVDDAAYQRNITSRFMQATNETNAGLPPSFWKRISEAEFRKFCETRQLTPKLKQTIADFAAYGRRNSDERLAELQRHFKNVRIVEIA